MEKTIYLTSIEKEAFSDGIAKLLPEIDSYYEYKKLGILRYIDMFSEEDKILILESLEYFDNFSAGLIDNIFEPFTRDQFKIYNKHRKLVISSAFYIFEKLEYKKHSKLPTIDSFDNSFLSDRLVLLAIRLEDNIYGIARELYSTKLFYKIDQVWFKDSSFLKGDKRNKDFSALKFIDSMPDLETYKKFIAHDYINSMKFRDLISNLEVDSKELKIFIRYLNGQDLFLVLKEVIARRNIIVHKKGIIDEKYMKDSIDKKLKINTEIKTDMYYFLNTISKLNSLFDSLKLALEY